MFLRLAKYGMDNIDEFLNLAKKARRLQQQGLERIAANSGGNTPDDWLVDDFAQLDDFGSLCAEFAIVGLWRCVELYGTKAIRVASGNEAASKVFNHKAFQKELLNLGIVESRIRCARSVDELRCLNNSIKHEQRVGSELAGFRLWQSKKGRELGNLEHQYRRLRPVAERYLVDLADRLDRRS